MELNSLVENQLQMEELQLSLEKQNSLIAFSKTIMQESKLKFGEMKRTKIE